MDFPRASIVACAGALSLGLAPDVRACATAAPARAEVAVAQESAVVVWDARTKTEHFLRRAVFRTQAPHFGFLVPSPTRPMLAEATDEVFDRLEHVVLPEIRYDDELTGVDPTPLSAMVFLRSSRDAAPTAASAVRVLEERRVGAFDAAVLQADDATALATWLGERGYDERPSLTEWLEPYVAKHWIVTAFKIADPQAPTDAGLDPETAAAVTVPRSLGGGTVQMTFKTDRPFFPYREPADQRDARTTSLSPSRALRVFYVGETRAEATIGDGSTPFRGKTSWAGPLPLHVALPVAIPPGAWLTAFEDDASPRPGVDELWLDPAKDRAPVKPPPVVVRRPTKLPLPADVLLALGGLAFVLVRRSRRRGARASNER